jgi:Domain of unknown function (DUF4184)
MPLTLFAHQAFVLPLKLRWPKRFDATALCVGSMSPDLAYPISSWLAEHSHKLIGLLWAVPFTIVTTWCIRDFVASTAFAHFPDFGPFRIHSLRALRHRRPAWFVTFISALIGSLSHIFIDSFTHNERYASKKLGFDRLLATAGNRQVTIANSLQFVGHTIGSLIGLLLLYRIGRQKLIDRWYGKRVVTNDRSFELTTAQRAVFALLVGIGVGVGVYWGWHSTQNIAFAVFDATAVATLIACLVPFCRPTKPERRRAVRNGLD